MKQLLILSGKGGTGKTTMASSFITLSKAKIYADCDVDAPNLHLIKGKVREEETTYKSSPYFAMPKAFIHEDKCIGCGKCLSYCRFSAIDKIEKGKYKINTFACEGCGVCGKVCSENAITMEKDQAGDVMLYERKDEIFSTAKLKIGSGTSGKLVAAVKKQMVDERKKKNIDSELAIVDGSPGIGCPVISSLSGVDIVLIVAEPSMSGMSDMKRILKTARVFGTKACVCVNKFNTNTVRTSEIENFCNSYNIPFVGKVPFDEKAVKAINQGISVVETECEAAEAIKEVYKNTMNILAN